MKHPSQEIDWTKYHRGAKGNIIANDHAEVRRNAWNEKNKGKPHPPTKKDLIFAREYIASGGNATKAARISDPNSRFPSQVGSARKKKLNFSALLDKNGVKDVLLAKVIREGLMAKKRYSSPTEPDTYEDDHPTRHKFLETALKVKGHMSNIETQNNIQVNIIDYDENK